MLFQFVPTLALLLGAMWRILPPCRFLSFLLPPVLTRSLGPINTSHEFVMTQLALLPGAARRLLFHAASCSSCLPPSSFLGLNGEELVMSSRCCHTLRLSSLRRACSSCLAASFSSCFRRFSSSRSSNLRRLASAALSPLQSSQP